MNVPAPISHMADGFARMSGQADVILAGQNGPGATNLVTGLAQAKAANSAVVSIAGALASGHRYQEAFQEVDQDALFKPVTKKVWTATNTGRVPELFREAFREALAPRQGPVQLNPPRDVLSGQAEFEPFQTREQYRPFIAPAGAPQAIAAAVELLMDARKPVIIAVGGIKNTGGGDQCMALAEARNRADVWTRIFKAERKFYLSKRDADADVNAMPIQPSGLFKTLRDVLPRDAAVTMATDALNFWQPKSLFTQLDFGLVGFSFAAGLGIKLAAPERPVVSLMGDGGFGMTVSELSTAVDHGINTVTVVMNNRCWGAEKAYQRDFFAERYIGADISSPPFDKLAELYGAKGYKATTLDEMAQAIEAALVCGKPAVIDTDVDPSALYSFRRDSFEHRAG